MPSGNTPTGVGKTINIDLEEMLESETPPRAWGRQREIIKDQRRGHVIMSELQGAQAQVAGRQSRRFHG